MLVLEPVLHETALKRTIEPLREALIERPPCHFEGFSPISTVEDVHESFSSEYVGWMSTKHVRSTADLVRFGCALKVECTHCSATRTLTAEAAAKGLGKVELRCAAKRFRCLRCGMKAAKIVVLPPV
jgi:hypothetical protein